MASRRSPVLAPPEHLRITKLRPGPAEQGWLANVSVNGTTVSVQQKPFWSTEHRRGDAFRQVLPPVAAALSGAVATAERRGR